MTIGFRAIEFEIPTNIVPILELEEIKALSKKDRKAFDIVMAGCETVAIDERDNSELTLAAARKAIEAAKMSATDIDAIVFLQSRSPAHFMSSEATRLQEELGIKKCFSMAVGGLGCANFSAGLQIARQSLMSGTCNNVLIAGASKPAAVQRYRDVVTVVGDAGMGAILSRDCERHQVVAMDITTDGRYWDLFRAEYKNKTQEEIVETCTHPHYRFELAIASRNTFAEMNQRLCEQVGIDPSQIKARYMQNLSLTAFQFNEEALGAKFSSACHDNCRTLGHLGSLDVLLNYKVSLERGEIAPGDIVLIQNNSPVACWSSKLLRV